MLRNVVSTIIVGENFDRILFKLAFHYAETGMNVWFVSPEPFNHVPTGLVVPDKEILKLITFLYLKDHKDLLIHLNGIHLWQMTPSVIILNGYENYTEILSDDYNSLGAALVTTALLDGAATCARKIAGTARVIMTCIKLPEKHLDRLTILGDLYFLKIVTMKEENEAFKEIMDHLTI